MRIDKSENENIHTEDEYYTIEEYQSTWSRWCYLTHHYLNEHEFGELTSCGQCWQETGCHGTYNLDYAIEYCNALNKALINGEIDNLVNKDGKNVTEFRICKCERTYKKTPLHPQLKLYQTQKE